MSTTITTGIKLYFCILLIILVNFIMANRPLDRFRFEQLLGNLSQETQSTDNKLRILFNTHGFFTAHQAARIIFQFRFNPDKVKALEIMQSRLLPMSASEARDVISAFSFMNDKLRAVGMVKRYICNSQRFEGKEFIANSLVFDEDKKKALQVLETVRSYVKDVAPAGGHAIYGPMGHIYARKPPFDTNIYGLPCDQSRYLVSKGIIEVSVTAKPTMLPSKFTGHPSYAYKRGRDYAQDRVYPGCPAYGEHLYFPAHDGCPAKPTAYNIYPAAGPPLNMHQAAIAPTGFQTHATYN